MYESRPTLIALIALIALLALLALVTLQMSRLYKYRVQR